MSLDLLELGRSALGELVDEVVFVGGATVVLWITDPGAPPPRPTKDVDVIIEVATRSDYHAFEDRLRRAGFTDDKEVICRWRHRTGLLAVIRAVPPAYLVATKLEAHFGRSPGDLLGSRDFGDIVALVDGREELVADAGAAGPALREYVARALRSLLAEAQIIDGVRAQLLPDGASQARAEDVVLPRLHEISRLS